MVTYNSESQLSLDYSLRALNFGELDALNFGELDLLDFYSAFRIESSILCSCYFNLSFIALKCDDLVETSCCKNEETAAPLGCIPFA